METKLRAIARRPGVRYHCEEWTTGLESTSEFPLALLAEYDV